MRTAATTIAIQRPIQIQGREPIHVTLLQLVEAVCEVTDDDHEVVATVLHMLHSGRVRLCGNFRGSSAGDLT